MTKILIIISISHFQSKDAWYNQVDNRVYGFKVLGLNLFLDPTSRICRNGWCSKGWCWDLATLSKTSPQRIKPMLSMRGTRFLGKDWSLCNLAPLAWPSCLVRKIKLRHLLFSLQNLQMGPKFPREYVCPRQQGNIENPCFPRVIWAFLYGISAHCSWKVKFPCELEPICHGKPFFPKSFAHLPQWTMWNFEKKDKAFWNFHVGHWWLAWVLLCQRLSSI
jgi:hypothetical protein